MTIKSKSKTDQKGGLKPTKKGTLSSSLASIMKSGGVTVGAGKTARAEVAEKILSKSGAKEMLEGKKPANDGVIPAKMDKLSKLHKIGCKKGDNDMIMGDKQSVGEDEVVDVTMQNDIKWDGGKPNHGAVSTDDEGGDKIEHWENAIKHIESVIQKATSKERKESLEIQLATAQMMLKQALLTEASLNNADKDMLDDQDDGKSSQSNNKDTIIDVDEDPNEEGKIMGSDTEMAQVSFNWADVSDDETVVLTNHQSNEDEWHTVHNKKNNKHTGKQKKEHAETVYNRDQAENSNNHISNPYKKQNNYIKQRNGHEEEGKAYVDTELKDSSSLLSYLETVKNKTRSPNQTSIRVTTSFTPRTSGHGDFKRVARELLEYASDFDPSILLLPWDDNFGGGPISLTDLANPHTMLDAIKHYFDKPSYINWQPGSPVYGIGVRFSTNFGKHEFLDRWNIKKREHKVLNKMAYTINLAPMQTSAKAYVIGIAVGSTEDQDYELLNKKLANEVGIPGMEVSFQNINQMGITQEFWKIANTKAKSASADKLSREHLRMKYLWAPNAIAIYVPNKEQVNVARKVMIKKYGSLDNGNDPVWPDGSSMRFLPIKGATIRNTKTKEIVRKRMAFHIWLKANGIAIETNMVNIHNKLDSFEGRTFSELVLDTKDSDGSRVFQHFNRVWSNLRDSAQNILKNTSYLGGTIWAGHQSILSR